MKKYSYTLLATLMAMITTMTLVSCDGDDDNEIHSYLTCPDNHHPHMIDLGLPSGTLWACCNVGADKPRDCGGYYAWGETEEKDIYNEVNYQYCTGEEADQYGFYHKNKSFQDLGSDIASTQYDVAHVKWGGSWVMPSISQFEELLYNTTCTWTKREGVYGRQFSGRSGGSIFLPAAGYYSSGALGNLGTYGSYWSSTQNPSKSHYAYEFYFNYNPDIVYCSYDDYCIEGRTVRPVIKK